MDARIGWGIQSASHGLEEEEEEEKEEEEEE